MRDQQTLRLDELREATEAAMQAKGLSQSAVAVALDVDRSTVHRALTERGERYVGVLRRIIAHTTEFEIEDGPLYRVRRKG